MMACTQGWPNPAARFRVLQYLPHLRNAGWEIHHRPSRPRRYNRSLPSANPFIGVHHRISRWSRHVNRLWDIHRAPGFDLVWINRDLFHSNPLYEQKLHTRNPRTVFDFDDAVFVNDKLGHTEWCCRNAGWVVAGNRYLADYALRHTDRVSIIPTVLDVQHYDPTPRAGVPGIPRVGWCGSNLSIRQTLYPILGTLRRIQERLGFEFVIMTRPKPRVPDSGLRWSYVEWSENNERQLRRYMDIGVMPLVDEPFQRGKCGLKLLQYMASGLPVVASPVGVNRELAGHGERGFLADSEAQWHAALGELIDNEALRAGFGEAGRRYCEQRYSIQAWLPELIRIFDKVSAGNDPA